MARRRYQTGSVFVRGKKNPVYVGRFRDDVVGSDGRVRRRNRTVVLGTVVELNTLKNARRALEPFLANVNSVGYRPSKFSILDDFIDSWECRVLPNHKRSSIKSEQSHLRTYIRPWLGKMRLEDITTEVQQTFVTRLSQCVSRKTIKNVLTTLSSILSTAKAWGYCSQTLTWSHLRLPPEEERKPLRFFTAQEIQNILALAGEPARTMFAIAATSGLRVGEIIALQRQDIDLEQSRIHVRRAISEGQIQGVKTRTSSATVDIPIDLTEMMRLHVAGMNPDPAGFLFVNRNGKPYSPNKVVQRKLHPILDALGIPRTGFHAFRRGYGTGLNEAGANPKVTQKLMRHADFAVTFGSYVQPTDESTRKSVERWGATVLRPKLCAQVRPN